MTVALVVWFLLVLLACALCRVSRSDDSGCGDQTMRGAGRNSTAGATRETPEPCVSARRFAPRFFARPFFFGKERS